MEKIVEISHAEGWTPYRNNYGDWVWQMPDDNSPHDFEWPGIKPPSPDCIPVWKDDGWYWSQPTKHAQDESCDHEWLASTLPNVLCKCSKCGEETPRPPKRVMGGLLNKKGYKMDFHLLLKDLEEVKAVIYEDTEWAEELLNHIISEIAIKAAHPQLER